MPLCCIRLSLSLAVLFFITGTLQASADLVSKYEKNVRRQTSGTFGITGIQAGGGASGAVPIRQEIRQLAQNDPDQFNLFVLALYELQNRDQTEMLSYYQIAGIHGRPFVPWDGVQPAPGQQDGGYCAHSSILFPTWHRPYLALFEQELYGLVQTIAGEFTGADASKYQAAAANFRLPYWDWAATPPYKGWGVISYEVGDEVTIQVTTPTGTTRIPNPLYSYAFHPLNTTALPDNPFDIWQTTLRDPTSQTTSAQSQDDTVNFEATASQSSFAQRIMNLLSAYPEYANFSNKAWIQSSPGSYDSLESLHDQIHGLVGGNGGHMAVIEYSSFDPIFWLHHVNVDRIFAIWQTLHPDSYVVPTQAEYGTYTNLAGSIEDVNTNLTPFHKDTNGNFWTSETVRNTSTFGYSYPELQWWNASSSTSYISSIKAAVNVLYGNSGVSIQRRGTSSKEKRDIQPDQISLAPFISAGLERSVFLQSDESGIETYREWLVNIRVPKYALGSSFFVNIFLGNFDSNSSSPATNPSFVGTQTIFASNSIPSNCASCQNSSSAFLVTGTIPLTRALQQSSQEGRLNATDEVDVEAFLTQNLHWEITSLNKMIIPSDQVPGLKLSVVSAEVTNAQSLDEFCQWSDFTVHINITNGRPGGLNVGDPV